MVLNRVREQSGDPDFRNGLKLAQLLNGQVRSPVKQRQGGKPMINYGRRLVHLLRDAQLP